MDTAANLSESPIARKLVEHFGGRKETEKAMEVNRETVRLWLLRGIPLERALDVEERTGGIVTAEDVVSEARAKAAETKRATA